jgi:hypothetical protein
MNSPTSLKMALAGLALAASFCAFSSTQKATASANNSVEKKVIFADGTDPMPACRKNSCPQIADN